MSTNLLTDKPRPVNECGARVTPSNLREYRGLYDFQGPTCMCASQGTADDGGAEAAIFMSTMGDSVGEYVAACASGKCGYWGERPRRYNVSCDLPSFASSQHRTHVQIKGPAHQKVSPS
jgi:hypothetical protein